LQLASELTQALQFVGVDIDALIVVEALAKHHLIIAHELTNVGNDRGQLSNMANQAREEIEAESLTVVADRGY
jgi:hypothetical protein